MLCRVGMTTDITSRKAVWKSKNPTMRNWTVKARGLTRKQAQAKEIAVAAKCNCVAHGGGANPSVANKRWTVYHYNY